MNMAVARQQSTLSTIARLQDISRLYILLNPMQYIAYISTCFIVTHAGTVFVPHDLDLWPYPKINGFPLIMVEQLYVKFSNPSCTTCHCDISATASDVRVRWFIDGSYSALLHADSCNKHLFSVRNTSDKPALRPPPPPPTTAQRTRGNLTSEIYCIRGLAVD